MACIANEIQSLYLESQNYHAKYQELFGGFFPHLDFTTNRRIWDLNKRPALKTKRCGLLSGALLVS